MRRFIDGLCFNTKSSTYEIVQHVHRPVCLVSRYCLGKLKGFRIGFPTWTYDATMLDNLHVSYLKLLLSESEHPVYKACSWTYRAGVCACTALGNNLRCLRRVNIDWLALFRLVRIYPLNQLITRHCTKNNSTLLQLQQYHK